VEDTLFVCFGGVGVGAGWGGEDFRSSFAVDLGGRLGRLKGGIASPDIVLPPTPQSFPREGGASGRSCTILGFA
jgi:hypothetical protein